MASPVIEGRAASSASPSAAPVLPAAPSAVAPAPAGSSARSGGVLVERRGAASAAPGVQPGIDPGRRLA
jgi:hypothetical protein